MIVTVLHLHNKRLVAGLYTTQMGYKSPLSCTKGTYGTKFANGSVWGACPRGSGADDSRLERQVDGLGAGTGTELRHGVAQMRFDRPYADAQ